MYFATDLNEIIENYSELIDYMATRVIQETYNPTYSPNVPSVFAVYVSGVKYSDE